MKNKLSLFLFWTFCLYKYIESKIVLLSYATDHFNISKIRFEIEAKSFYNFDKIRIFDPTDLPKNFTTRYQDILRRRRGAGYWIWRIYFINNELKNLKNGDILLFVDIGCSFKKKYLNKFHYLINLLKQSEKSIIGFHLGYPEKKHTKTEIFDYFNISETNPIRNTKQLQGGILFLKKSKQSQNYVNLYMKAISDEPELNTARLWKTQDAIFKENRHDQSLHSVICKLLDIAIIIPDFTNSRKTPIMATRLGDRKILKILEQYNE